MTPLEGWPEDERDHIEGPGTRKDRLWDGRFADEVKGCSYCGRTLPADQLWVVKHRHASQPKGHLRSYCSECLANRGQERSEGTPDRTGEVCPVHNIATSLTGDCDLCN